MRGSFKRKISHRTVFDLGKSVSDFKRRHGVECAAAGTAECGAQRVTRASRFRLTSASDKTLRSIASTCLADVAFAGYEEKMGFNHKNTGMARARQATVSIFAVQGTAEPRIIFSTRTRTHRRPDALAL
jgi:hypothetical protein